MTQRILRFFAVAVVVPAVLALGIWGVHEAYAACTVHFDNAFDNWDTNSAGSFGIFQEPRPDVRVDWTSTQAWTLFASDTPGNQENLATSGVTPESRSLPSGSDDTTFTIFGSLQDTGQNGLYELSVWHSPGGQCSGAHPINILK